MHKLRSTESSYDVGFVRKSSRLRKVWNNSLSNTDLTVDDHRRKFCCFGSRLRAAGVTRSLGGLVWSVSDDRTGHRGACLGIVRPRSCRQTRRRRKPSNCVAIWSPKHTDSSDLKRWPRGRSACRCPAEILYPPAFTAIYLISFDEVVTYILAPKMHPRCK